MNGSLPRPGYASVTATLAPAVALGGTSYAATRLPKGSGTSRPVSVSTVNDKIRIDTFTTAGAAAEQPTQCVVHYQS